MNGRGTKKSLTFRFRYDCQDEYCADIRKGCAAVVWEARVVVPADPADRVVCNMEETMIQLKGIRKSFYEGTANDCCQYYVFCGIFHLYRCIFRILSGK